MTMLVDPDAILNSLLAPMKSLAQKVSEICITSGSVERLDEVVRQRLHELGDRLIVDALRQLGNRLRFEQEVPNCTCGKSRTFKQMRPLRIRSALTGNVLSIPSPYIICDSCKEGQLWLRELLHLDEDGCTPFLQELSTVLP